jgi:hypothetical protein
MFLRDDGYALRNSLAGSLRILDSCSVDAKRAVVTGDSRPRGSE